MMATNVTEKDKTLNEIIEWCETRMRNIDGENAETAADALVYLGEGSAFGDVANHCRSMLGYSGSMPSEVPNQSDDAKKSSVSELLPHDMGLRVELDTNETYYLKSGWAERCDGIYGLACGYVDYAEDITWFKDPARIAIMNSHVKLAVPWEEPETETTKQSEDAK